jgi:hypothetical protein
MANIVHEGRKTLSVLVHHLRTQGDQRKKVAKGRQTASRLDCRRGILGLSIVAPEIFAYSSTVLGKGDPVSKVDHIDVKRRAGHGLRLEALDGAEFDRSFVVPTRSIVVSRVAESLDD